MFTFNNCDDLMNCSKAEFQMRVINTILAFLILVDLVFGNMDLMFIEIPTLILGLWYNKILHDNLLKSMKKYILKD